MKRTAVAALVALTLGSVMLWTPGRALAQIAPPNRNAVNFSVATFSGAPVYSIGADVALTTPLDLTFSYSTQSVGGVSGSLYGLGLRYHFNLPTPGVDLYLGGGLAGESASVGGFPAGSVSGISLGGGVSVRLGPIITGYASGSVLSLGGTSNSIIDLGLLFPVAPRVGFQVGFLDIAGSGAPYIGVNVNFPSLR
jgi:hypothetical protein